MRLRILLSTLLCSIAGLSIASKDIDFSNTDLAKQVLLDNTWSCQLVDLHGKTDSTWKFKSIEGNKITGSFEIDQYMACSADHFKGKLKNNTIKYYARTNHSSCRKFNGTFRFFRDNDGSIKADGHYEYGGLRFNGKYTCTPN